MLLTSVQKIHWHCVMVVICSRGNSPRHSLHETRGSTASSHVGRYRDAVIFAATELEQTKKDISMSKKKKRANGVKYYWEEIKNCLIYNIGKQYLIIYKGLFFTQECMMGRMA